MGEGTNGAGRPRVLVITAYYKEDRALLERAMRSVAAQTVALSGAAQVDHMLVADGFPQAWIDAEAVRHVRLDRGHADYGNTPRGVGSLLGMVEGYDAICYCDADNWYEPTHVEVCLKAAKAVAGVDYVIARRHFRRPDETVIPVLDESIKNHVDTNCFFFLPGSFPLIHHFAAIPRQMSVIGDRLFYAVLQQARLKAVALKNPTVNYLCLWRPIYEAIGEVPPEGAKPGADHGEAERWLASIDDRGREIVSRLTGLPLGGGPTPAGATRSGPPRVLVVTAYYKESREMLERCIASVAAQTARHDGSAIVDQMMIADGFPQDWIVASGLRHVELDRAHGDYGNTPRGVGAVLAISEGYDALCFLDADNAQQPEHVAACLARAAELGPDCDWVISGRTFRRPDWTVLPIAATDTDIDTNCFFFLRGSFHLLHFFGQQPREIALAGDQVFNAVLKNAGLIEGRVPGQTLDYLTLWASDYLRSGEVPPPEARPPADGDAMQAWIDALPPERRAWLGRMIGI